MWKDFQYGVCYYPEHWNEQRWPSDIARMAACGFNVIRLGEGAWSCWEPREGQFQFELFDRVIDLCRRHHIRVVMGTPTYAAPAWVSCNYPAVLRWDFRRTPMAHGSRRNFNYTSPKYLELSDRLCTALAEHYRDEPQIIAWQLDNEFNCHMDVSYAPSDTLAFREWLREKYQTLGNLNDAWGTRFWSQTYDDWDQINLPAPTPTVMNPTTLLDETRFISDCVVRFARRQADILRRTNPRWLITHNGLFTNINGPDLAGVLDFFSHDQYPLFNSVWTEGAAQLVQARSLSFPYAILEQQSGPGGQTTYFQRTPRPREMRLWAWQSIAHGAKLLSFFRWRTCPYGSEQHWHGLLDADDRDNRRIEEAKQIAADLQKIPAEFFDAPAEKQVAVLRDFDNETNDRRINTYVKSGAGEFGGWLAEFARRHVPNDLVWPGSDFSPYRLLIAPHLKMVDGPLVLKLTSFVRSGGVLVFGAQSGLKDRNAHVVEMPLPGLLRELAGLEVEDWTTLPDDETRIATLATGGRIGLGVFVERLRLQGAEAVALWTSEDSLLANAPAIARRKVGQGWVYYIGGYSGPDARPALADLLMKDVGLQPLVDAPAEVEAINRLVDGREYLVLLNHSAEAQAVQELPAGRDLLRDVTVGQAAYFLPPYEVAVVQSDTGARRD